MKLDGVTDDDDATLVTHSSSTNLAVTVWVEGRLERGSFTNMK